MGARSQASARSRQAAKSRDEILDAAFTLMLEVGIRKMTIEAVASTAGVGKTTIYRWWRSKGLLALDAFDHGFRVLEATTPPDTGSLRGDLNALTRQVIESVGTASERLGPQIIAEAQHDPELAAEIYSRLVAPYRALQHSIFDAAARRAEISSSLDSTLLLDALYGAYFHRLLLHHGAIDTAFFDALIELLVSGAHALHIAKTSGPTASHPER
jgi:AcrR family transcriptional regulator